MLNFEKGGLGHEKREVENFDDLAIFTSTLYKDDEVSRLRQELAYKFFTNAERLGVKCVVIDGGSNEEFIKRLKGFSNVDLTVDLKAGMGESRRAGLQEAIDRYNVPYYLWIEPEKYDLIKMETLKAMIDHLRENQADIVVPKRKDLSSMPEFQRKVEFAANRMASNKIYGREPLVRIDKSETIDLWFGPKMFNRSGAENFLKWNNDKSRMDKWDSIIGPIIEASVEGKKVISVDVDFRYDPSEKELENQSGQSEEMAWKRAIQFRRILENVNVLSEDDKFDQEIFNENE